MIVAVSGANKPLGTEVQAVFLKEGRFVATLPRWMVGVRPASVVDFIRFHSGYLNWRKL